MLVGSAVNEISLKNKDILTFPYENAVPEEPSWVFLRLVLEASFFILIWLASNIWRIVKEKRKNQKFDEAETYKRYLKVSNICDILEKAERRKLRYLHIKYQGKRYKRKTSKRSRKRLLANKNLSKLWNKLNHIGFSQSMIAEKIAYQCEEAKFSSDDDMNGESKVEKPKKALSFLSSFSEMFAFIPKLQSTERGRSESEIKLLTTPSTTSDELQNQTDSLTLQMLNQQGINRIIFEPQSDLLAPNVIQVSSAAVLTDACVIGGDYCGFDRGKISPEVTSIGSDIQEERKMIQILHQVEEYNIIKDVELCNQIQEAQMKMKSEMENLKSAFWLPPENIEITRSQILDCPLLQTRKKMLQQVDKRMEIARCKIEVSNKNFLKLSTSSKGSQSVDLLVLLMRSLVWQQKHEERLVRARNKIVQSVKSAMETRFRGMILTHNGDFELCGTGCFCYDCATGRHKLHFIDGVDGCDIEGREKILNEADGFGKDCTVARVINSWFKDLELERCGSTKVKADRMESLLNKVLKEMYLKRYYERGQLISQKYLTVSSNLYQHIRISPKNSIPLSDD